jgi:hypothetical protein
LALVAAAVIFVKMETVLFGTVIKTVDVAQVLQVPQLLVKADKVTMAQ